MARPKRRNREESGTPKGGNVTFVDFVKKRLAGEVDTSHLDGLSVGELRVRLNQSLGDR